MPLIAKPVKESLSCKYLDKTTPLARLKIAQILCKNGVGMNSWTGISSEQLTTNLDTILTNDVIFKSGYKTKFYTCMKYLYAATTAEGSYPETGLKDCKCNL